MGCIRVRGGWGVLLGRGQVAAFAAETGLQATSAMVAPTGQRGLNLLRMAYRYGTSASALRWASRSRFCHRT